MREKMTKEQFAQMLDGRVFDNQIDTFSEEEILIAKESGLVIGYPGESDRMAFAGAITDVSPMFNDITYTVCRGGELYIGADGIYRCMCDEVHCPHEIEKLRKCKRIVALWRECDYDSVEWKYETKIPHATFRILTSEYKEYKEEGFATGIFYNGIVFEKSALA